ncbi:ankyrin repeat-containing domain protein [Umbelopsis sp. PMI_123]|nr:ankyrin repeat-containing domain protein [Umbelopsis sp. PMI_123]
MVQIRLGDYRNEKHVSEEVHLTNNVTNIQHLDGGNAVKEEGGRLHWFDAAISGNIDNIRNLLDYHGAYIGWEDGHKCTALHLSAGSGHKELVSLLLDFHAAVDAKDEKSRTALHEASLNGHKEVIDLLLSHGADIEAIGLTSKY